MGDRHAPRPDRRPLPRRSAALAVWYLRAVAFVNFLSAGWVSLGQDVRRHNQENLFTPYLLTAGFASGVFAAFLAVTMRRRKRAAWILNLALSGAFLALFAVAMAFPEVRRHPQNWVSLALTAGFVAALLAGRGEFYAKGDRANPGSPRSSPGAACWGPRCWRRCSSRSPTGLRTPRVRRSPGAGGTARCAWSRSSPTSGTPRASPRPPGST